MAENKGIDVSDGDWICFVDGDDVLQDDAFMILSDQEVAEHDIVRFGAYVFSDTLPQSSFEKKYSKDKDEYIQRVLTACRRSPYRLAASSAPVPGGPSGSLLSA